MDTARVACVVALGFGALLRVREYSANRALWLDESQVALNIIHRSYLHLLRPLAGEQGAPIGWLWLQHTGVRFFGSSEWVLRGSPLLLSLGTLAVFFMLVQRWLSGVASVLACAMFALSPDLIRYAVEVKPYGGDVLFVLLVVVFTTRFYDEPTRGRLIAWIVVSTVTMWCSYPAIIALAGSGLVLLGLELRRRRTVLPVLTAAAVFGVSLGLEYLVNLHGVGHDDVLRSYWDRLDGFGPKTLNLLHTPGWVLRSGAHFAINPLDLATSWIGIACTAVGCVLFVARRGWVAMLVFSPVVVAIIAGLARQFPLRERIALYLVPLLFVGLAALAESRGPFWGNPIAIAGAIVVVFVASPIATGFPVLWHPLVGIDARGPYQFVDHHFQPGDAVAIEATASSSYNYYAKRFDIPRTFLFSYEQDKNCSAEKSLAPLRQFRRFWIVRTHHGGDDVSHQTQVAFDYFSRFGTRGQTFFGHGGTWAALFETSSRSTPADAPRGCIVMHRAPSLVIR